MSKKKNEAPLPDEEVKQDAAAQAPEQPDKETSPDPASTAPAPDPIAAQLAAEKEKYLRLAAEYDNYRKRSLKERDAIFSEVRCDTVLKLLPIYDNLARALKVPTEDLAFLKGVEMTMKQFMEALAKLNVKEIPAVGEQFDPTRHNAVMHVEDESYGKNVVIEEFEKGFMLGDKVVRFSLVRVAN